VIFLMQRTERSCDELAAGLAPDAEKELAAFVHAVQELFGPEQARQSTEDWLEELESMDLPRGNAVSSWRPVTIASAIRLASRVNSPMFRQTIEFPNLVAAGAFVGCDKAI
jgi:hypothetical protein